MRAIITYRDERGWRSAWVRVNEGDMKYDGPPARGESSLDAHAQMLDRTLKEDGDALKKDVPQLNVLIRGGGRQRPPR